MLTKRSFMSAAVLSSSFESCGQSNCLGEIATTEDSGKTWLVRWRHPRIGNVTVARGSNDAWVEDSANAVWLRSRDRGRTWRRMPGTKGLTELSFPTSRV